MLIKEREILWESAINSLTEKKENEAMAYIKYLCKEVMDELKIPTNKINELNLKTPTREFIEELRLLDKKVIPMLNNEYLIDNREIGEIERYFKLFTQLYQGRQIFSISIVINNIKDSISNRGTVRITKNKDEISRGEMSISKSAKDFFTSTEAAEILGVSDQTIRRWCENKKIPHAIQTIGGHWRIPKDFFKVTHDQATKIDEMMEDMDNKSLSAGEVDEFDL